MTKKVWLTPTVVGLGFEPSKKFQYEPGQFISLMVPSATKGKPKFIKRAYSFASPDASHGYELCIKRAFGGVGSEFIAALKPGDEFKCMAPYGDFAFIPKPERNVCFIATGTGVAPFRGIVMSEIYRENRPKNALLLFGARTEDEIIYPGFFESLGVETVNALSKPPSSWKGFKGRVTDYINHLPRNWPWHSTDFYICGNGQMAIEVRDLLQNSHGVNSKSIFCEVYFTPQAHHMPSAKPPVAHVLPIKKAA